MYSNNLLLDAAGGLTVQRPPVWLMRQAGRILPEYRAVRARAGSFIALATTPELAAEVTLQPVDILGVDAAIIFSDILVIPEAMGLPYQMEENKGPVFVKTINTMADIAALRIAEPQESLAYVTDAIRIVTSELAGRVPLIGFAGAPFTILAYMVEGSGSKTFSKAKRMLYCEPQMAHELLNKITLSTIAYLKAQIEAGAALVQLFDSWAGVLSPESYQIFALPYIEQICKAIAPLAPITVFAKGAHFAINDFNASDCNVIGLDWNISPEDGRKLAPNKILQGNLDPCLLYASPEIIRQKTIEMIDAFGAQRYIVNLGHGLYPDISPDHVKVFVETVKNYQPK